MSEFVVLWEKYSDKLSPLFVCRRSFVIWLGLNEDKLPFGYTIKDILELRQLYLKNNGNTFGGEWYENKD